MHDNLALDEPLACYIVLQLHMVTSFLLNTEVQSPTCFKCAFILDYCLVIIKETVTKERKTAPDQSLLTSQQVLAFRNRCFHILVGDNK